MAESSLTPDDAPEEALKVAEQHDGQSMYWLRFEDVDGRVLEDGVRSAVLPAVGQLIPIAGTHAEVMEQWTDRSFVPEGGPEVLVFTVKSLAY